MKLLIVLAGLAILAWISQLWDERERRAAKAITDAAVSETEATCRQQRDRQAAYVEGYAPDVRSLNALAGKPIAPPSSKRSHRRAA